MSNYIGNLSVFDHKIHEWDVFKRQLMQFLILNNIPEPNKNDVLLTNLSDESYRLIQILVHPKNLEYCTFTDLIGLLDLRFTKRKATFADREKFHKATQSESETLEEWADRVRALGRNCDFRNDALDMYLRDRYMLGLRNGPERDELFNCDLTDMSFEEALQITQKVRARPPLRIPRCFTYLARRAPAPNTSATPPQAGAAANTATSH